VSEEKIKNFWQKCKEAKEFKNPCGLRIKSLSEQLSPSGWPDLKIVDRLGFGGQFRQRIERIAEENRRARIDFSPRSPEMAMPAPYYNLDRDLSQLYIYTVSGSSLFSRFYGRQSSAFFVQDPFYGQEPDFINNLARWFGINYIFSELGMNRDLFQKAGWEYLGVDLTEEEVVDNRVLRFPEENSLAELSKKPTVLVIGQKGAYDQVYQIGQYGALPYQEAFIVWGDGVIDHYSLEELQDFDVLVLHGYTYKSQAKADRLLSDYVGGGGKIFIETGWQYTAADWQTPENQKALEIIPLEKLSWKDLGKTSDFVLENSQFDPKVDVSKFSPLIYGDQAWGVSTGEKSDLKDWARVVLSAKGYPLVITGKLGKGRIVWSGAYLFTHAKQGESIYHEEIKLMNDLFAWLTEGISRESFPVVYQREHPDRLEFKVEKPVPNGGFLLWKEAYHPDFKATLVSNLKSPRPRLGEAGGGQISNLDVYRAGPGMTLIKVPELRVGERIVYEYRQPLSEKVSLAISFLILLCLPVLVLEGTFLRERNLFRRSAQFLERKLGFFFFDFWKKPFDWWKKEDEGY